MSVNDPDPNRVHEAIFVLIVAPKSFTFMPDRAMDAKTVTATDVINSERIIQVAMLSQLILLFGKGPMNVGDRSRVNGGVSSCGIMSEDCFEPVEVSDGIIVVPDGTFANAIIFCCGSPMY